MRAWQVGQAMTRRRAARRSRRAAGTLRVGGEAGPCLAGGVEERVAPDEGDHGEVAVQARPGPSLVVAEPEFLLAILMEPLDRPALVGQAELLVERPVVQGPGEVPLRLAGFAGQRTLADEPAERAGRVAVCPVDAEAAGLAPAPLLLRIEDRDGQPLLLGDRRSQDLRGMQRRDLVGMGPHARATSTGGFRHRAS